MADIQHSLLPDNMLHQPKGASTATFRQNLIANGDGTTSFVDPISIDSVNTVAATGSTETLNNRSIQDITLDSSCTLTFPTVSGSGVGHSFTLIVRQGGSGSYTITWPASVDWPGGAAPTLSTTIGAVDILCFTTVNSGTTWFGFVAGQAMS